MNGASTSLQVDRFLLMSCKSVTGPSLSTSVGLNGLWRPGRLHVLLLVHPAVRPAVCQRGSVRPVLQSRR